MSIDFNLAEYMNSSPSPHDTMQYFSQAVENFRQSNSVKSSHTLNDASLAAKFPLITDIVMNPAFSLLTNPHSPDRLYCKLSAEAVLLLEKAEPRRDLFQRYAEKISTRANEVRAVYRFTSALLDIERFSCSIGLIKTLTSMHRHT